MIDRVTDFTAAAIGLLVVAIALAAVVSPRPPIIPDDPQALAYLEAVGRLAGLEPPPSANADPNEV